MKFGKLDFIPVEERFDLVASPVQHLLETRGLKDIYVSAIDSSFADTAAFCEYYNVVLDVSANCVIVEAKRAEKSTFAACMILATDRIDVNNVVRRHLDARKISFAPMEKAVTLSGMEYGGITPVGLPEAWPILVDEAVAQTEWAIIGSGIRGSKLLIPGRLLAELPGATTLNLAKRLE